MEHVLTVAGVLVALFLVLRVSLARRGKSFGLRGGLTALNILTGLLAALAGAVLITAGRPDAPGPAALAGALRAILPFWGATLGGIAGYLLFGALWRRLFHGGSASIRAWLLRAQFAACAAAILFLLLR